MILHQDKDFIEKHKRALSRQLGLVPPPCGFEESSFTKCRHSPWHQLHFPTHSVPAVIGVEATSTPSMVGFLTSNFPSTPSPFAPSTQESGWRAAFHALQTSIPP